MKSTRTQSSCGAFLGLVSGAALWLSAAAGGQTAPSGEVPAVKPAVMVERRGHLLILSYKLVGADGQPYTQSVPSSRPEFTIRKGNRQIASGQFEYG